MNKFFGTQTGVDPGDLTLEAGTRAVGGLLGEGVFLDVPFFFDKGFFINSGATVAGSLGGGVSNPTTLVPTLPSFAVTLVGVEAGVSFLLDFCLVLSFFNMRDLAAARNSRFPMLGSTPLVDLPFLAAAFGI